MSAAAWALSHLVAAGGSGMATDLVKGEISRIIDWTSDPKSSENHQIAALLICTYLCSDAPLYAFAYLKPISEIVWSLLLVNKGGGAVCRAAFEAFRALLLLMRDRADEATVGEFIRRCMGEALERVRSTSSGQAMQGALAGIHRMVKAFPSIIGDSYYGPACETGFHLLQAKDTVVRSEAINLIAELTALNGPVFAADYLPQWIKYLLELLKGKDRERLAALQALKATIDGLKTDIAPAMDSITQSLRQLLLQQKGRAKGSEDDELMRCVGAMARALQGGFGGALRHLLPAVLAGDLTVELRQTLQAVVDHVPLSMPLIEGTLDPTTLPVRS